MTRTIALWITVIGGIILGLLWMYANDKVPMPALAVVFGLVVAASWVLAEQRHRD